MDAFDVVIVGGGPAGSTCAWELRRLGLSAAILDKAAFPRNKVCGGWITPAVLEELQIDPAEYSRDGIFQPITGFRTGFIGGREVETHYGEPVSYGIRRYEFDDYLLKRSGAKLLEGVSLTTLERSDNQWIVNGQIRTPMLIGAGGHFCPVARFLGAKVGREASVVAQEVEFELDARQLSGCAIRRETPELYFCSDMRGYGWCFRKQNILNVGLGRQDSHRLSAHVAEFLKFLKTAGKLSFDVPPPSGHAYLLYGATTRNVAGDGVLLVGDAAGLAYAQSGEGIRPAVESGLLAARVIVAAKERYSRDRLQPYRAALAERFGGPENSWLTRIGSRLPTAILTSVAHQLLATQWFARDVVLDRWFLHSDQSALSLTA